METHLLTCDNLGMTRDMSISSLAKGEDGSTNYAFENHNIRILAVNDNTKFTVTNEKSTKLEDSIQGYFLGGCTCGRYLVLFITKPAATHPDYIYRLEYNGTVVNKVQLYNGNLGFSMDHPIEAIGYYESEEIQKVYWVDGLNQNRFINIVDNDYIYVFGRSSSSQVRPSSLFNLCRLSEFDKNLPPLFPSASPIVLYAFGKKGNAPTVYSSSLEASTTTLVWRSKVIEDRIAAGATSFTDFLGYQDATLYLTNVKPAYNDYSFDFQGHIENIPVVTITKEYEKVGTFQAGVLQYFMTYYNKYGVETCLVWSSDLQYISLSDRGAKADEDVSCAFSFEISNLDANYDYLRVYACYRSGLNGVVSSRIVTDIDLTDAISDGYVQFTDYGSAGINFNAEDIPYIGGQDCRANTLDYKQDTLFLGDITVRNASTSLDFPKESVTITDLGCSIKEGGYNTIEDGQSVFKSYITWAYKFVSPVATDGLYEYHQEIEKSQKAIAGFKYREVYRFGIQFMDETGYWTPAYWIGDKYCDLPPRELSEADTIETYGGGSTEDETWDIDDFGNFVNEADPQHPFAFKYEGDGCYIATVMLNIDNIVSSLPNVNFTQYKAYRLLVAETDITNRRIVEQGVINPTMFNYVDRYYNRPFSIPSWIFRPRMSKITNRHYDTLPVQTESNAELQGITKRQIPGFKGTNGNRMNSYMFIFAVNDVSLWTGHIQWKLIYYNSGDTDLEKAERAYLAMYTGRVADGDDSSRYLDPSIASEDAELDKVAHLIKKYNIHVRPGAISYPGSAQITDTTDLSEADIKALLTGNDKYVPTYIYGNKYKVVSSRIYKDKVEISNWSDMRKGLVELITKDMRSTKAEEVGEELAGKIVLSPAMLPDEKQLKDVGLYSKVNTEGILLSIAAALAAAAAIVLSVLSFGTLTAPAAIVASIAVSAAIQACATAAIGMASAAAMLSLEDLDREELYKTMLAKGYIPVKVDELSISDKRRMSKHLGLLLEGMFEPEIQGSIHHYIQANGSVPETWVSPVLAGDLGVLSDDDGTGNVPFTNGHAHNTGYLGDAYNAYVLSGNLSVLDEDEEELKKKQNLFCIDESIVTLNAPDLEENTAAVDSSEGLKLDLVGIIPIDATYGIYDMSVEGSLNSSSQVISGRYKTNNIGEDTSGAIGMLNGYLYQDFYADPSVFELDGSTLQPVQLQEEVKAYRTFMWNRSVAGFWFPGITLLSPIDSEEKITSPKGVIQRKLFANMRYSKNSIFYNPASLAIEAPKVCLDSQTMLKTFEFGSETRNYYENVDTISVNENYYPLVVGDINYPETESGIINGSLKDPIHIRYRQGQHAVIPLSWDTDKNAATILPYTASEEAIDVFKLYGEDSSSVILDGATAVDSIIPMTVYWIYKSEWTYSGNLTINNWSAQDYVGGNGDSWWENTSTGSASEKAEKAYRNLINLLARKGADFAECAESPTIRNYFLRLNELVGEQSVLSANYYITRILNTIDHIIIRRAPHSDSSFYMISKTTDGFVASGTISSGGSSIFLRALPKNTIIIYSDVEDSSPITGRGYAKDDGNGVADLYDWDDTDSFGRPRAKRAKEIVVETPLSSTWSQAELSSWTPNKEVPYLFLGELVKKEFDYTNWNGGTSDYALQQLIWNVASAPTAMDDKLSSTWGDTYYQRWDCLKTYPFTEQDVNSNVEVLSFMLESHTNLDGRCDVNRGIHNLLNTRPSNTVYNDVYSQSDNFFTYQMLDEKFSKQHFETDVMWSLTKNNMDDIDRWTSLIATNEMSLDGRYGPLRKILNVNDTLVTFQDRGIAQIKYNESAALSTTSGLPVQMGNTGKVDGYRMLSDTIGCVNKFSINKNSAGVFFADDFGKSFNQFTINGGIVDLSTRANFSTWFKKNLNGHLWDASTRDNFRTSYDEITHDLYITKNNECLVYNTLLQKFTSFMDYKDTPIITRLMSDNGTTDTFAIHSTTRSNAPYVETWKMFAGSSTEATYGSQGAYGYIYGSFKPYSMEYRLNPDPLHDSIFTNYQYAADWIDPAKEVEEENAFNDSAIRRYTTFDTVEAKNEYQKGTMAIQQSGNTAGNTTGLKRVFGRQPIKSMFRLWRGDIPRNGDTVSSHTPLSDRMRNPWIHLKFIKSTADDSKMKFHNLMVNYYNQYGRF